MRARLKGLSSPDVDDLERWSPDGESFGFLLQALIGPADGPGEESFDFVVCTPDWFAANQMAGQSIRSGHHTLFVGAYDYRALKAFVERAVHAVEADDWRGIAERLSWLGHWEFANYRP
jgi:hypothetical protein